MPQEGCAEHVFLFQAIWSDCKQNDKNMMCAWLDLANAFGSVPHEAIITVLKQANCPEKMINIVKDLYTGATSTFRVGEGETDPVAIEAGVKQGCPLSPILFNLVTELLIREVKSVASEGGFAYKLGSTPISIMAYADDLILVAKDAAGLQAMLNVIGVTATKLGLNFKPKKCATFHHLASISAKEDPPEGATLMKGAKRRLIARDRIRPTVLLIQGNPMPALKEGDYYKYLGIPTGAGVENSLLSEKLSDVKDDLRKIRESLLAPWQKLDAFRTFVQPKLGYLMRMGFHDKSSLTNTKYEQTLLDNLKKILHLPARATNSYFFAERDLGGIGLANPTLDIDILHVTQSLRMLSSADTLTKTIARDMVELTVGRCLPPVPKDVNRKVGAKGVGNKKTISPDDICTFLSGDHSAHWKKGGASNAGSKQNQATLLRKACGELNAKFGAKIAYDKEKDVYGIAHINDDGENVVIHPRDVCKHLRAKGRKYFADKLHELRNQGKVAREGSIDKCANGTKWIFTGAGMRFCDWRYAHKARLGLHHTRSEAALFARSKKREAVSDDCRRCGIHQETLPHIQACNYTGVSQKKRHDYILNRLCNAPRESNGMLLKDKKAVGCEGLYRQGDTPERPDLQFIRSDGTILLSDVAVTFEAHQGALQESYNRKTVYLEKFAHEMRLKGYKTIVAPFVIGANGTWFPGNGRILAELGIRKNWLNKFRKYCSTDAIRGSRDVFVHFMTGTVQFEGKYANSDPHVPDKLDDWSANFVLPNIN